MSVKYPSHGVYNYMYMCLYWHLWISGDCNLYHCEFQSNKVQRIWEVVSKLPSITHTHYRSHDYYHATHMGEPILRSAY